MSSPDPDPRHPGYQSISISAEGFVGLDILDGIIDLR